MEQTNIEIPGDDNRVRELADRLGFIPETDFQLLADATPLTVREWRKRGYGPKYVRLGRRYYYPLQAVREFMESIVHERNSTVRGAALL
ncbi:MULTISPECIES: helix-turn-helix transcriptional regulator [Burkholderia]|uniref:helix-turn-helix transcriptional regulator n=1 Tax=Burkholderia TaxID=32008 RepID=UPI000841D0E3|nr:MULTISPECIES: helix-turn-helix domain-containing protein [unclassified Burkholderia]AOK29870.1 hypothetical protein AQ611_10980 [Burkholderia sp. Bp7605]